MSQQINIKPLVLNFVSIVCLVTGVLMAIPSFKILYKIHRSSSFIETTATIITSDIRQKKIDSSDWLQQYMPKVWYSYYVNKNKIITSQLSFNDGYLTSKAAALAVIENYPAGKEVKVFYDENDPGFSVLLKEGIPIKDSVLAGLAAFFILSGVIALWTIAAVEMEKA